MGNVGTPITQPIPVVGTTGTEYATQINAFLTEVKSRLEAQIPFSAILGTGTLDAVDHPIINMAYAGLYDVGAPPNSSNTGVLSLSTYLGDLYWTNANGTFKMTAGLGLNLTSNGGIGGDYSTTSAALNFVNATSTYEFYAGAGSPTWAYTKDLGHYFVSTADNGFAALLQFSGAASYTITLPAAAPAATAAVSMSSGGVLGTGTINTTITLGSTAGINLSGTGDIQHATQWELPQPVVPVNSAGFGNGPDVAIADGGAARVWRRLISGLRVGDIIQKATFRWLRSAGTHTFDVMKVVDGTETSLLAAPVSVAAGAAQTTTATLAAPYTVASNEQYLLVWTPPSGSTDRLYSAACFITH